MQPEISIRCASCGASVREPAMFCPECGKALAPAESAAESVAPLTSASTDAETPAPIEVQAPEMIASTGPEPAVESISAPGAAQNELKTGSDHRDAPESRPGPRERTREKLHRASSVASSVARGALEDNVKRVEKIHHVSTAMIEEATYDPSLRFVLVALGLFVVFVVLLILSKVMG